MEILISCQCDSFQPAKLCQKVCLNDVCFCSVPVVYYFVSPCCDLWFCLFRFCVLLSAYLASKLLQNVMTCDMSKRQVTPGDQIGLCVSLCLSVSVCVCSMYS